MTKRVVFAAAAAVAAWLGASGPVQAQMAPAVLPLQGFLTDGAGTPIDGDISLRINLYDSEVATTDIFTETQTVMVDEGHFVVYVGDVTTLDLAIFRDNSEVWVGLAIDGGTELPRFQLGTVPYAAFAQFSNTSANTLQLAGTPAADYALRADTQARVTGTCPTGQAIAAINADGTVMCRSVGATVMGACPTGQAVVGITATGALTCAPMGDITGVAAGSGLTGGGTSGDITLGIATGGVTAAHLAVDSVGTSELQANAVTTAQVADGTLTEDDLDLQFSGVVSSTTDETVFSRFISTGALSGMTSGRIMVVTGGSTGRGRAAGGSGTVTVRCGATVVQTILVSGGGTRPWTYVTPSFSLSTCGDLDVAVRAASATSPVVLREISFHPGH